MLRSFGIARKLWTVCLAFALPIVVMFVLMTREQLNEIAFTSKEVEGDAYQRPLEDLLEQVSAHEQLWLRSRLTGRSQEAGLRAQQAAIAQALDRLDTVDRVHGEALQFTPLGLGLRKRDEFTAAGLRRKWSQLADTLPRLGTQEALARYRGLALHVRTMITHAGDSSNLILDPDLDSYYLMDVTLLALPQMEERLGQIAVEVQLKASAGALDAEGATQLATMAAFLRESDWERVVASANTAFNEDPNFQGSSPTLAPTLKPKLARGNVAVAKVIGHLQRLARNAPGLVFDIDAFNADVDELEQATYDLHRTALDEEDRLLQARVDGFRHRLWLGCALAVVSLIVSSLLALALARNITRRVGHVSRATKAFAAGDLSARVGAAGGDELGELGESFDAMANRIGGLATEVRERAEQLAELNRGLEATVDERTRELRKRNDAVRMILDNAHDGMLTVDLQGVMSAERSAAVERWFGPSIPGARLQEYLGSGNALLTAELELGFQELRDESMPLEVVVGQLPRKLQRGPSHYRLGYQPILEEQRVSRLLVVISDATSEVENQRAAALQEETVRIFHACQRDRAGFIEFFANARELVAQVTGTEVYPVVEIARAVHTLKGNCALFGVFSLSSLCHQLEDDMAENGGTLRVVDVERLRGAWADLSARVARIIGEHGANKLEVADDEYAAIVDAVANGTPRREILMAIAKWKLEPASLRLNRLAERAQELARRLGKEVEVEVQANGLRLCSDTWAPLWAALTHGIRNSIDHGLEHSEEREQHGKPGNGRLRLCTRIAASRFYVEVADDGRGIDWSKVAAAAKQKGLPHATSRDLIDALFADGVSTVDEVTEWSGRGVGMSAVREACRRLGGIVEIETQAGQGTTIRCSFPEQAMGGSASIAARDRPVQLSIVPAVGA